MKNTTFSPSIALNGRRLLTLVTMQLHLGRPLLSDIHADIFLIIK